MNLVRSTPERKFELKYPELEILSREKNMEFSEDRKVGNWQRKTRDMFSIPLKSVSGCVENKRFMVFIKKNLTADY